MHAKGRDRIDTASAITRQQTQVHAVHMKIREQRIKPQTERLPCDQNDFVERFNWLRAENLRTL
jgi:hypothetical protein